MTAEADTDFAAASYWDDRYAAAGNVPFDFYCTYKELKAVLSPFLSQSPDFELLVPGCGSSSLSADLFRDGYRNVTSVDISGVVIEQMTERYRDHEEMEFSRMARADLYLRHFTDPHRVYLHDTVC